MSKHNVWVFMTLGIILSLLLVACGGAQPETQTTEETGGEAAAEAPAAAESAAESAAEAAEETAAEEAAPAEEASYLERAEAGEFEGTKVEIFSVWVDEDSEAFEAALAPFVERTGIEIAHDASSDFESLITVRVEGGDAPDIAVFPQPGLMTIFAREGQLAPLDFIDREQLSENYIQSWIDLGTVDGQLYGIFYRASTKSLVWYPVPAFEEAGYEIPETWDEMLALSDQMVADGNTPWCISIEHSGATGWVATDWMEDIMLRTAGPEVYDQWVNHEIPFNHPSVKEAAEVMGNIWFNPDYVLGGTTGILSVPVADTQTPMFDEGKPGCWLHRQAGWIPAFFPEGKEAGTDSNFFYLPPIDEEQGRPVLGGGDIFAMFNDRPEVRAVMEYLATPEAAKGWVERGGFISPNNGVPLDWYPNDIDRAQAEIMQNATTFRFDASDLMPGEIGTGSFWTAMVDYVGGQDLDAVLQRVEDSWPQE